MINDRPPTFLLLNCGSTFILQLMRALTDLNISLIKRALPVNGLKDPYIPDYPLFDLSDLDSSIVSGIIISGSRFSVNGKRARLPPSGFCQKIVQEKIPILGICYGHQLLAHLFGAKINKCSEFENGEREFACENDSPLFSGLPLRFSPFFSHIYQVEKESLPSHFSTIGSTKITPVAAYQYDDPELPNGVPWLYGVQFHPENSEGGVKTKLFRKFLQICLTARAVKEIS